VDSHILESTREMFFEQMELRLNSSWFWSRIRVDFPKEKWDSKCIMECHTTGPTPISQHGAEDAQHSYLAMSWPIRPTGNLSNSASENFQIWKSWSEQKKPYGRLQNWWEMGVTNIYRETLGTSIRNGQDALKKTWLPCDYWWLSNWDKVFERWWIRFWRFSLNTKTGKRNTSQ